MTTDSKKLTESGLARFLSTPDNKVSRQYIHILVQKGILKKDAQGFIDVEEARESLLANLRSGSKAIQNFAPTVSPESPTAESQPAAPQNQAETKQPPAEITSFHVARTMREAAEAQIAKLKLAERREQVIRVEAVRAAWARRLSSTRDALLQIPSRLGPVLAAETDPEKVTQMLDVEVRHVMAQMSQDSLSTQDAAAP